MNAVQAADLLDISARRVRNLIRRGTLSATKGEDGEWRISESSVERLREEQKAEKWEGVHEHRVGRERARFEGRAW